MFPHSRMLNDSSTSPLARAYASVIFDVKRGQEIEDSSNLGTVIDSLGKYINFLNDFESNYNTKISNSNMRLPLGYLNAFNMVASKKSKSNEGFRETRGEFCFLEHQLRKLNKDSASFYKENHEDIMEFLQEMENSFYK